jgi:hypothetical protein
VKPVRLMQIWLTSLAALASGLALGSCGKVGEETQLQLDSNTNWLKRCDADDECGGSLRCYCGQCSLPCGGGEGECSLLAGAECAASGDAVCNEQAGAGGLCVLACGSDQECGLDFSCTSGQCVPKPCAGAYLSVDDVYANIALDLARLAPEDAPMVRYVTLANHFTYRACESTLAAERQGLSKLLNSLSLSTVVTPPVPIDADQVIFRLNMRDYDWDRAITVRGVEYPDVWEALTTLDPYAMPMLGGDASDAAADTLTRIPVLYNSTLIATATNSDVYRGVLDLPERIDTFLTSLVGDGSPDARAGFAQTREIVASHFRMESRVGFAWELAALRASDGRLFEVPLEIPEGDREVVFTLANGMLGFAYTDRLGSWLDSSLDFLDLSENDFRSRAPLSGLRRHWPGVAIGTDVVRASVEDNPDRFDPATRAAILLAYPGPGAIADLIERENEPLTRVALAGALVDPSLPEPISKVMEAFTRDVDLDTAAGELMVTREFLEENLNLLAPEFQVLDGGNIGRRDFSELYRGAFCTLSAVLENVPDPAACPP